MIDRRSASENRRCLPTNVHAISRRPAIRRSHDSRTLNNRAAWAGVCSNLACATTESPSGTASDRGIAVRGSSPVPEAVVEND
jgi:hypothetical protein